MDHEDTMLNEIHQTKRKTYFPLYIESKKAKSAREGEIMVARQWHPTPVLLPGKSHGRRSLVGSSPWGR